MLGAISGPSVGMFVLGTFFPWTNWQVNWVYYMYIDINLALCVPVLKMTDPFLGSFLWKFTWLRFGWMDFSWSLCTETLLSYLTKQHGKLFLRGVQHDRHLPDYVILHCSTNWRSEVRSSLPFSTKYISNSQNICNIEIETIYNRKWVDTYMISVRMYFRCIWFPTCTILSLEHWPPLSQEW